jgi:5'-3' exonuclease|tara:strand:- start:577 stop:1431 length:855 start_codon:yes stop_codon:yes gene_type:complete
MILVDMNQISLANVMMHLSLTKRDSVDGGMVRHMILNSILNYRKMFFKEYGELIICYDSKHYWRRDVFPEYKASRKKTRESSSRDWDDIFSFLNEFKQEMIDFMPYKVLEVYGAEADDIIAALCHEFEYDHGKTLILSGDKDFIQLQKYNNVSQYSPITKKFVNGIDPDRYLAEHILRGDTSDGVPNVLSPDNTFVDGLRQKPLSKKKVAAWIDNEIEDVLPNDETIRNFQRNKKLIDLTEPPKDLFVDIIKQYQNTPESDRSKLLNYFIEKRLTEHLENIGDF